MHPFKTSCAQVIQTQLEEYVRTLRKDAYSMASYDDWIHLFENELHNTRMQMHPIEIEDMFDDLCDIEITRCEPMLPFAVTILQIT